ncbi:1-aminocyclopropane-1-carboxylate deaminase/D-cysteine desulfhydrase [Vibrio sp. S4M6]|uniref:1-aminocyclopropane-1-carboxylate deaminase/D-cysteine desulfhydrase n=1 Tax=Vibrio sinus TaxID=2946865 RepID=UPI00202A2B7C|nr:1-aminocyclopropane-1-carboxylate deaminase/D-cysteine desulfhydrase [Vibrio sinus]MCL9782729.1 1-aminocyclopropane-1-carboxylate deaminase/D-cysteine desulfhydrase [Vibrio sinus]
MTNQSTSIESKFNIANSPVTSHCFDGISFYLKRDDKLHSHFSGNKARKFAALLDCDDKKITTLVSYGSPQANSLYSLAALAHLKGWQLEYYVDRIPAWLEASPIGNYLGALKLGATVSSVSQQLNMPNIHPSDYILEHRNLDDSCLYIPEGGYFDWAAAGIEQLANEILEWKSNQHIEKLTVALPSGTGTTAGFLAHFLAPNDIQVLTCPCVSGKAYLTEQISQLVGKESLPTILELESKHHFGKLYQQDYKIWQRLLSQTHVEFDLLYDPMMWRCLLPWIESHQNSELLYIHQGGLLGNQSMLPRYQRKYPALTQE